MTPDPASAVETPAPLKSIPPARDRLQSRLLVWIVAPFITLACAQLIYMTLIYGPSWQFYLAKALAVSIAFALAAWALRAATPAAALIGGMICLLLTCYTGITMYSPLRSALAPLLALFLLTFLATRAGRKQKMEHGLAESRKGRRVSQVIANLGIAAILSNPVGDRAITWLAQNPKISDINFYWVLCIIILAALAEATADTVSSEIGQAFGGTPFLLTTFRRVPPGTDGAISLIGTITGILAATIVVGVGAWSMHLHADQFWIALVAGTCGLFFDSLLGATVERRGYIGNDLVNFTSTAFAAGIALLAIRFGQDYLIR
ncbi:MAG TPA: DUF92 domain-containing protein [Acidobacteriaceae bacterium]